MLNAIDDKNNQNLVKTLLHTKSKHFLQESK